jgi:hypothetical protein
MSNELMIRDEALMPTTFDGLLKQAQVLVKSGMLPEAVRTPEAAVVIMLKGRELNIPPMQAFASIYVVKGKPTIGAQLMGALILRDGHSYHVESLTDEGCVITFTRRGGKPYTHKFTIEDATKAGLLANDTWKKYPKAMLFSRCMSAGARIAMPDVLAGMYTPEELTDSVTVDAETGEIVATATVVESTTGNDHEEEAPHGFTTWGEKVRKAFWARTNALKMDEATTHREFGVKSMSDYTDYAERASILLKIVEASQAMTFSWKELHEALVVEYLAQYTGTMADAVAAMNDLAAHPMQEQEPEPLALQM